MAAKEKPARGKSLARNGKEIFRDFFFFAAISFFGKPSAQVHLVSAGEIGRVLEEGREGRFVRSFGGGSVCISSLIYPSLSLFPPPPPKFLSYFHKEEEEERADGVVKGERSKAKAQGNERTDLGREGAGRKDRGGGGGTTGQKRRDSTWPGVSIYFGKKENGKDSLAWLIAFMS